MLKNEKYVGDLLFQKTYTVDSIEQCRKLNHGKKNQYLVKNNHPAIIDRNVFELVQTEMQCRSRKQNSGLSKNESVKRYSGKYALTNILVCGECGAEFKRNGKTTKPGEHKYYWRCTNHNENCNCKSVGIEEEKLHNSIISFLSKTFPNSKEFKKYSDDIVRKYVSAVKIQNDTMTIDIKENK